MNAAQANQIIEAAIQFNQVVQNITGSPVNGDLLENMQVANESNPLDSISKEHAAMLYGVTTDSIKTWRSEINRGSYTGDLVYTGDALDNSTRPSYYFSRREVCEAAIRFTPRRNHEQWISTENVIAMHQISLDELGQWMNKMDDSDFYKGQFDVVKNELLWDRQKVAQNLLNQMDAA